MKNPGLRMRPWAEARIEAWRTATLFSLRPDPTAGKPWGQRNMHCLATALRQGFGPEVRVLRDRDAYLVAVPPDLGPDLLTWFESRRIQVHFEPGHGVGQAWNMKNPGLRMTKTVDLNLVLEDPTRFEPGPVRAIHALGPYHFIEFGSGRKPDWVQYAVYVESKWTGQVVGTLDQAMVTALAIANCRDASEALARAGAAARVLEL